jgi:hypothetical protein
MSDVTPQPAPNGPPAGFYDDPDGSGRQRWFDGSAWSDHYQTATSTAPAPQQPVQVTVAAPLQTDSRKARDKSQYVRQQKGHSFILEWFVLGIFTVWIRPIYFSVSPNHYWHL